MNGFPDAAFERAAGTLVELPAEGPPEIAFAGRSNVGKSSAINALLGRRALARTSRTPGRTQTINFYAVGDIARFVDLPGYGFARVPLALRSRWRSLVGGYLASRAALKLIVVVMDARHAPTSLDLQLIEWLQQAPHIVVLTKADKLSRRTQADAKRRVRAAIPTAHVVLFSSTTRQGVEETRDLLQEILQQVAEIKNPR